VAAELVAEPGGHLRDVLDGQRLEDLLAPLPSRTSGPSAASSSELPPIAFSKIVGFEVTPVISPRSTKPASSPLAISLRRTLSYQTL
jgi:hypothetical protein